MVDIEKAKDEFIKYTKKFNLEEPSIKRKQEHSLRVMEISNKLAKNLNLEKEKIEIATLIGLLHDIARFEQYTKFKTFSDLKSFDHGDYGVELLETDDMIRKYIEIDKYDVIIKKAIKNHNKFLIEEGLTEEEMLFCKIIRDADKLDIFYEVITIFWEENKEKMEKGTIQPKMKEQFYKKKLMNRKDIQDRTETDKILQVIAFIYDINFEVSFKIIKEEKYIDRMIDKFDFKEQETKQEFKEIKELANKYIEEKLNKG